MNLSNILQRFVRDTRATALMEFAFSLPILLLCAFVLFEFATFHLARIKTDRASYMLANTMAQLPTVMRPRPGAPVQQYRTVDSSAVNQLLARADTLLPRSGRGGIKIVASSFSYVDQRFNTATSPAIPTNAPILLWGAVWQTAPEGVGEPSTVSTIARRATLPASIQNQPFTFDDADTQRAIASYGQFTCGARPESSLLVEVFFHYRPVFFNLFKNIDEPPINFLAEQTLVSRAFVRPRPEGDAIEAMNGDAVFNIPTNAYFTSRARGFCN